MTGLCVRCERPIADGYACTHCAITKAGEQLDTVADMTPAARDVAHGQARRGPGGGTGEPRLPLNLGATQRLDAVQNALGTWARHVAEIRGGRPQRIGADPVVHAARYLAANLEWMRHRAEVDEFLTDVARCASVVAGIARGPAEQRYLGPCGAPEQVEVTTLPDPEPVYMDGRLCEGDVYARGGAQHGTCRTCGATVDTAARRAWLDGEVRSQAFRASQIAEAYGVSVDTIRSWAARGRLRSYWRTAAGLTVEWTDPPIDPDLTGSARTAREAEIAAELADRGPRLHYVGDVLDLAAANAARRAEEQAKRARRAAAREAAAESEGDAA